LRTENGLLVADIYSSASDHKELRAKQRADWYIGGLVHAFLTPICRYEGGAARPLVFPDAVVDLSAPSPLVVDGLERHVYVRHVVYPSDNDMTVACENGKLVGVRGHQGRIVTRVGDAAVGRALDQMRR